MQLREINNLRYNIQAFFSYVMNTKYAVSTQKKINFQDLIMLMNNYVK